MLAVEREDVEEEDDHHQREEEDDHQEELVERNRVEGRFMMEGVCSRSSRSETWRALESGLSEYVAVKRIKSAFTGSCVAARAASREVVYLSSLQGHKNVVVLWEAACGDDGSATLYTRWASEGDARSALRRGALGPEARTEVGRQLFEALAYVHSAGIVHGDVEPGHVLVSKNRGSNNRQRTETAESTTTAQLCGFGKARFIGHALDREPATGRLEYRPVDALLTEKPPGKEGDVWAAGCVLLELETRVPVFAARTVDATLKRQLHALGPVPEADLEPRLRHRLLQLQSDVGSSKKNRPRRRDPSHGSLYDVVADAAAFDRSHVEANPRDALGAAVLRETLDVAFRRRQDARRDRVCDLAHLCLAVVPERRCSADLALLHPLFAAAFEPRPPATSVSHATFHTHCGDALHDGGQLLAPSQYQSRLRAFLAECKAIRALPPIDPGASTHSRRAQVRGRGLSTTHTPVRSKSRARRSRKSQRSSSSSGGEGDDDSPSSSEQQIASVFCRPASISTRYHPSIITTT